MRSIMICLVLLPLLSVIGCHEQNRSAQRSGAPKGTVVIVHGAWGGGWAFRGVDDLLTAKGYRVYRPTLTGQGERVHLANQDIGLDVHINDVVNTLLFEELESVVLIGHSYGGMVVTGVADRVPDRIAQLIYLDAMVPLDGESVVENTLIENKWWLSQARDGFISPSWIRSEQAPPKDVPHPFKTFTDVIVLKNPQRLDIPTDYILTAERPNQPERDDFFPYAKRAESFNWPVHILRADHNPQWSKPKELADLFDAIIRQ